MFTQPASPPSRIVTRLPLFGMCLSAFLITPIASQAHKDFEVLVFSKTVGFRHDSITNGIETIRRLGTNYHFGVEATEDASLFTDANLSNHQTVVFLSTTGDVLDNNQQAAFERYVQAGGGFVGDADDLVPVGDNTAIIEERYRKLGGTIEVIHKPGIGHHPHSLPNPKPIVDFILAHQ